MSPPPAAPDSSDRSLRLAARAARPVALSLIAATLYYVFLISAGRMGSWFTWSAFYDAQAEGFRGGHLYLPERPSAALMALPKPLDPANMRYWRWDYSYRDRHLYIYWGLVPAALLAAGKTLLRIRYAVGDDVLVFLFVVGRALGGTLLIRELGRRRQPAPPRFAVGVAVLVFLTANPTPYIVNRPAIYEAAIMAGSCFLTAALYFALRAVAATEARARRRWLLAASVAFGLAAGSRVSLLPAVALLIAFTALACWRSGADRGHGGRLARLAALAGAPAALIMGAHFVVNQQRFGRWSEFGANYQMSLRPLLAMRFVPVNLFFYLFQPVTRSCRFPFLMAKWDQARSVAPSWLTFPADYRWTEPSAGLLIAAPFAWLILPAAAIALRHAWLRRRAPDAARDPAPAPAAQRWAAIAIAVWLLAAAAPVVAMFSISMRYQGDFASPLMLAATLSGWRLLAVPSSRGGRALATVVYLALAIATVVFGVLLGFGGYFDHFQRHNPALWSSLTRTLNVCARR